MKLFDDYEIVKLPEEDALLVTRDTYLYYIYNPRRGFWKKYHNAGNDSITVSNYKDVSEEEIISIMGGVIPKKRTDLLRLCMLSELSAHELLDLLADDYPAFMSDGAIHNLVYAFLHESDIPHKSYLRLKEAFDDSDTVRNDHDQIVTRIKKLSFEIIGRDIYRKEIGIIDGHDCSSYFWIMPVRVIDFSDTDGIDSVAEMRSSEISIEEGDVSQYLSPFLYRYFDPGLDENKKRVAYYSVDGNGNEDVTYKNGFEWYLTYNFYTFNSMADIIRDIRDTIDALSSGTENEYTSQIVSKKELGSNRLLCEGNPNREQLDPDNGNKPDNTEAEMIIDFYHRFIYRIEYMMKVGREKGFNLISFMGP